MNTLYIGIKTSQSVFLFTLSYAISSSINASYTFFSNILAILLKQQKSDQQTIIPS